MAKKEITPEAMRLRMADLCSRTEQCESDIRTKILRAGLPSSAAEEIIEFLKEQKFIDNARFAGSFARDKVKFAGWGRHKIRLHLAAKRIPAADIAAALDSIDGKEYISALKRAGIAKARTLNLADPADAQKLYRHLISRGFESSLSSKLLTALRKRLSNNQ